MSELEDLKSRLDQLGTIEERYATPNAMFGIEHIRALYDKLTRQEAVVTAAREATSFIDHKRGCDVERGAIADCSCGATAIWDKLYEALADAGEVS